MTQYCASAHSAVDAPRRSAPMHNIGAVMADALLKGTDYTYPRGTTGFIRSREQKFPVTNGSRNGPWRALVISELRTTNWRTGKTRTFNANF